MKKGVALKIRNLGTDSAADIVNYHYAKMKEKGMVYYSTNIQFDTARNMEEVVFFFIHRGERKFVVADIVSVNGMKESFVPDDSEKFSPKKYVREAKNTWLMLENMRVIGADFIDCCQVNYTDGTVKLLSDVLESPRLNRVYYTRNEDDIDVLIK